MDKTLIIITIIVILLCAMYLFNKVDLLYYEEINENFEEHHLTKLCIMAIFKNEQDYIQEWLQHHVDQGIYHFYLYCNDLNINRYDFTKYNKYITLIPWVDKVNNGAETIQRQAYTHCVQNYSKKCDYIMMLDIDEFLVNKQPNEKVINFINLLNKDTTAAIKVQRYNFGSNGHKTKPNGSVVNNYTMREKICSSYKTIANTKFIDTSKNFYGVHDFNFLNKQGKIYNNYFTYEITGYPNGCDSTNINEIPLVINHYYTKSYDEYIDRCHMWKDGGVNNIGFRQNCEQQFEERDINEASD